MLSYSNRVPGYFNDLDLDVVARIARLAPRNATVVEVGAHFGRSTVAWADNVSDRTKIFVIDPWDDWEWPISAPLESIPKELRDLREDPRKWHEGDIQAIPMSLDEAFLNRYRVFKHFTRKYRNVYPIRDKSPPQSQSVGNLSSVDIIFLDGDHSEHGIAQDLTFWLPRLKENGILCGHDYTSDHDKMIKKIKEFSGAVRLPLWENPFGSGLWIMSANLDYVKELMNKDNGKPAARKWFF